MKATAVAPSNIAFIKYWGQKDEELRLPENGSISMNLSNLLTTTTVEFSSKFKNDEVLIDGKKDDKEARRVIKHLNRIRKLAKINTEAKVVSKNNFPASTGLSSSASGFAALTIAATKAAGLNPDQKELSILARQGSGSACRSIPDGFVEWLEGDSSETSYALSIFPPDHWDIADVVVIVSKDKKDVPTTKGHKLVASSPFFAERLKKIKEKIEKIKVLIKQKKFEEFGELIETEALELHAIMLTSKPSLLYWLPSTVQIMRQVRILRNEGLPVYFTVNTGQDIHLIVEGKNVNSLLTKLKPEKYIKKIIINKPGKGISLSNKHLF